MKLSICVPLFNKFFALQRLLNSIEGEVARFKSLDFEVVITNNGSSDATAREIDLVCEPYTYVRVIHSEKTISLPENWLLAVSYATGDLIKLQLADDELGTIDFVSLCEVFRDTEIQYVVVPSVPIFAQDVSAQHSEEIVEYFRSVNAFRAEIKFLTDADKASLLVRGRVIEGNNLFGDVNALFFRRECVSILSKPVRSGDAAVKSWPDLEIYLRLFLGCQGMFLGAGCAKFHINRTSTCFLAANNPRYFRQIYSRLAYMLMLDVMLNEEYSSVREQLTLSYRLRFVAKFARASLSFLVSSAR